MSGFGLFIRSLLHRLPLSAGETHRRCVRIRYKMRLGFRSMMNELGSGLGPLFMVGLGRLVTILGEDPNGVDSAEFIYLRTQAWKRSQSSQHKAKSASRTLKQWILNYWE